VKPGDIVAIPDHRTWVERGVDEGTYHVFLWRCIRCGRKRGRGRWTTNAGGSRHKGDGSPSRDADAFRVGCELRAASGSSAPRARDARRPPGSRTQYAVSEGPDRV
jgi:hypothetical protein